MIIGIICFALGCQKSDNEKVGDIIPVTPPASKDENNGENKVTYDSTLGCFNNGIVNGSTVEPSSPLKNHVVMILSRLKEEVGEKPSQTLCTGTLVGPKTVLTAAHCFPREVISTQIITSINLFCSSGFNRKLIYDAIKVEIHPDYYFKETPSISYPDHDIAIVHFEGMLPADYTPLEVKNIDIIEEMQNKAAQMVMIGYGRTQTKKADPLPELRFVTKDWDHLLLTKGSVNLIDRLGLIAVNQTDAHGGCQGDSGGPLLVIDNGEVRILGVASYIEGPSKNTLCENGHLYYSYISSDFDWIKRRVQ